jgi:hypothetical protein
VKEINLHYNPKKWYSEGTYKGTSYISSHVEQILTATIFIENQNMFPVDVAFDCILLNPDNTQSFEGTLPSISMRNLRTGIGKYEINLSQAVEKQQQVRLTKMSVLADNSWSSVPLDKIIYDHKIKPRKPLSPRRAIVLSLIVAFVLYKGFNYIAEKNRETQYRGVYSAVISRDSNVRNAPGLDGKVVFQLKKGENVIITDTITGPEFISDGRKKKYYKIVQSNYYIIYPEEVVPLWIWGGNVERIKQYNPPK